MRAPDGIEAVILDLDGVLTDTATVHERAWKSIFDPLLCAHGQPPFSHDDYLAYVDGKPRDDGVRSLLGARGVELPEGTPDDPPEADTVRGIAKRKNRRFLELIREEGVEVFEDVPVALERWRRAGLRLGMVSSSRNAAQVLAAARLEGYFGAWVDGLVGAAEGLAGKPAPDYFLEAAKRLGVEPSRAVVIEDATSGVEAGRRGGFGEVVGIARSGSGDALREHGADHVVRRLTDLSWRTKGRAQQTAAELPSLLDRFDEVRQRLLEAHPVFFFDYDGTLTPIVERPKDAVLPPAMREALRALARTHTVAVVSGRGLADVRERVGVDGLYYAGSHGFEIEGPDRMMEYEGAAVAKPELREAASLIEANLGGIEGLELERKPFSLAVHYRRVDPGRAPAVIARVEELASRFAHLRASYGKKVVELRPDVAWDKGAALRWVLNRIFGDAADVVPLYVGDDLTDEDAFREVMSDGIPVLVGDHGGPTRAAYRLEDPDEVRDLLWKLGSLPSPSPRGLGEHVAWRLVYEGYDAAQQPLREALCTLGNGFFATRGAAEEEHAGGVHYPGTYLAGGYNRRETYLAERWIENEDLVNWPNWLSLSFRPEGGDWFRLDDVDVLSFHQELDLRCGVLERHLRVRDRSDRETELVSRRLVHMGCPHLAAQRWTFIPRNWSGTVQFRSLIDGSVINAGVARYRALEGRHHELIGTGAAGEDVIHLTVRTLQSKLQMTQATRTRVKVATHGAIGEPAVVERRRINGEGRVGQLLTLDARFGREIEVEKVAALYTTRDSAIADPLSEAVADVERAPEFDELRLSHERAWKRLWRRWDMRLGGGRHPSQGTLRLHIFHLLQSVSPHTIDLDVGVTSRGLHGEAYRGHVFWDEIFIFPIINLRMPEVTRALLMYRYRRLPEARRAARDAGYQGAMYPWQSGSNGREESQRIHLNPVSGRWVPDETYLQRHVNSAIAYNIWQYFEATCDVEFLSFYGAEMMLEIAKFWASIAQYDAGTDRYHICGVVGPDEFHTRYPGSDCPGIHDNAYTNIMAAWVLRCVRRALSRLPEERAEELLEELGMTHDDLQRFEEVSRRMYVPFLDAERGLIEQFRGYGDLAELDWEAYRKRYGDIQRLDRILEAEEDSVNRYKADKQADVLMLFYLFAAEELQSLFEHLGYEFRGSMIWENIEYYRNRTTFGSSLSRIVYAWVLARSDRDGSWSLFEQALRSDIEDIQGGTTPEGIHLGAMAGTVDLVQRCYGGIETRDDVLWLNPRLPEGLPRLDLSVRYRGCWLDLRMTHRRLDVSVRAGCAGSIDLGVLGEVQTLRAGQRRSYALE